MTPLTHAAVGTLLCQSVLKLRIRKYCWAFALFPALCSHYLLDAIPHFEGIMPFPEYKTSYLLTLALGLIGCGLSTTLIRRNREAGILCTVLFVWVGIGNYSLSWLRVAMAVLGIAFLLWKTERLKNAQYFLAGVVAVLPDLIPSTATLPTTIHKFFHYKMDLGTFWYVAVYGWPAPTTLYEHLHDPYSLAGYGLEIVMEAVVLLGSLYLITCRQEEILPAAEVLSTEYQAQWSEAAASDSIPEEMLEMSK